MDNFAQKKSEIEIMLAEYEKITTSAAEWYKKWKLKNAGFKCVRIKSHREQK